MKVATSSRRVWPLPSGRRFDVTATPGAGKAMKMVSWPAAASRGPVTLVMRPKASRLRVVVWLLRSVVLSGWSNSGA